jgi:hypothetical protein
MPYNDAPRHKLRNLTAGGVLAFGLLAGGATPAFADAQADAPIVQEGEWEDHGQPSYATCPEGTTMTGGGFHSVPERNTPPGSPPDTIITNAPSRKLPNTWVARMYRGQVLAYAVCARR